MFQIFSGLISKGGYSSIALLLCSLVVLSITIQKLIWGPKKRSETPHKLIRELDSLIDQNSLDEAAGLLKERRAAFAKTALGVIDYTKNTKNINSAENNKKLKDIGCNTMIIPYDYSNTNKKVMMGYLEDSLFNQSLILPKEEFRDDYAYNELINQLLYLKKTKTPTGNIQYKAPSGRNFYDELPMSLAQFNYALE